MNGKVTEIEYEVSQHRCGLGFNNGTIKATLKEEELRQMGFWSDELEVKGRDVFDGAHKYTVVERKVENLENATIEELDRLHLKAYNNEERFLMRKIEEEVRRRQDERERSRKAQIARTGQQVKK